MTGEIENIPNADSVSRLIFFPRMYTRYKDLIWSSVFEFARGDGESVVWHKYAPQPEDICRLGCDLETSRRRSRPDTTYVGHIVATKFEICAARNARGNGFTVEHEPEVEGRIERHHAEVKYKLVDGLTYASITKTEKVDLRVALGRAFSPLYLQYC
jgi:hypothetical protein